MEGIIAAPSLTAAVHTGALFPHSHRQCATVWQQHSLFPDIYYTAHNGETKIDERSSSVRQDWDTRVAVAKEMLVVVRIVVVVLRSAVVVVRIAW